MEQILEHIAKYDHILKWLSMSSLAFFCLSLISLPVAIYILPTNYFIKDATHRHHSLITVFVRNILAIILILIGIILLFMPGQGVLTILMGTLLSDLPFKKRLKDKVAENPKYMKLLNKWRFKMRKMPFETRD